MKMVKSSGIFIGHIEQNWTEQQTDKNRAVMKRNVFYHFPAYNII